MAQISRSTKVGGGTTLSSNTLARAADVETDVLTLFNAHNNHDSGSSTWTVVSASGSSSVPLKSNNSTGTQNIFECEDNGTDVLTVADGGTTTVTANGGSNKALIANNGSSTGNIIEGQDNGTARFTVADGGTTTITAANGGTDKGLIVNNGTSTGNILEAQDNGTACVTVADGGVVTLTNNLVFNPTTKGVKGTTTNDSADAGNIGERVSSFQTATNFPTTDEWGDLTSISLTAGDWDVSVVALGARNSATQTRAAFGVSTSSGNDATNLTLGDTSLQHTAQASNSMPEFVPITLSNVRMSLAATTTVYLKYSATYSVNTPQGRGRITARRVR